MATPKPNKNLKNKQDPELIHDPVFTEHLLERLNKSGTIVLNSSGKCIYVSNRAEQILNLKKNNLLGEDFFTAVPLLSLEGGTIDDRKHPVWRALQPMAYTQVTPFFCRPVDREDVLAMNVMQVRRDQQVIAVVVQVRKAEREVDLGEMKSLFVSFAAHQLKTPSSVVKGFLELLMREGEQSFSEDQWHYLVSAFESNEQLIHVSKTLLSMARLEGGLIEPRIHSFDAADALQAKIKSLSSLLRTKRLEVKFDAPGENFLNSDDTFFLEIFGIIFANAIKHSPENSTITVTCQTNAETATVHVIDQGSGVPPQVADNIFMSAQAAQAGEQGHGLGLYMAKKYLALLGGSIGVTSTKTGSDFFFSVPQAIL